MAQLDELLDAVHAAEPGPQVAAAFDYDGTLISGFSAKAFYGHRIRNGQMGPIDLASTLLTARRGIEGDEAFAAFLDGSLAAWAGTPEEEMERLGRRLFKEQIASKLHHEAYALLEAHRQMGHTLVLASSALRFQTQPMATELGVRHVLNTEVELDEDGRLTGRALGTPLYGAEKAAALVRLATEEGLDLDASFAYSNGREDVPFLEAAGHPVAIEPDAGLAAVAKDRGWPILACRKPPGRPGLADVVRTAAFYGGFFTALGTGIGAGLLHRSKETVLDLTFATGSDVSLALAGVHVDVVEGAEHLWSARPCIFLFNHSSKIDAFVAMKLLRQGFTGVAKKEAKDVPVFGPLFAYAGMAFVDRSDTMSARKALEPVVEKLRSGTSLVMSPEGTRSATPRLGTFKKGAFHMAMQAGVPIVPMLFRGVDRVQWRGAQAVRPGRIEVCVLPPVDTSRWVARRVGAHRDEVRELMVHKLDHWPRDPAAPRLAHGAPA
jgi:putative phosphoserine phosphatase/1-acylglycerol-3-phosphate O-acyltransferase